MTPKKKKKMTRQVAVNVRFPAPVHIKLKELAHTETRSLNSQILHIIMTHLGMRA